MKAGTDYMECWHNRNKSDCPGQPRAYGHLSRVDMYIQAQAQGWVCEKCLWEGGLLQRH